MRINNEMAMQNSRHYKRLKVAPGNAAEWRNGKSDQSPDNRPETQAQTLDWNGLSS